jgi:DNA adenine methylase
VEYIVAPYKRYNGGKSGNGTYQGIINHIPPIDTLISLFTGNGGVERRINMRGGHIYLNDIDLDVHNRYSELHRTYSHKYKSCLVGNTCGVWLMENIGITLMLDLYKTVLPRRTLFYCDPPYLFDTRKGQGQLYTHEWQCEDHVRFLQCVNQKHKAGYLIAVNHPPHLLYENMLQGWNVYDYQSMTSSGKKMWDRLWYNYPPPTELQDYQYLGNNYRQREIISRRIKRQVSNIFKKYGKDERLNELQRNAAIQALIDKKK